MPKSVRDEILEIEHFTKSKTREKKHNKNNKYNKNSNK